MAIKKKTKKKSTSSKKTAGKKAAKKLAKPARVSKKSAKTAARKPPAKAVSAAAPAVKTASARRATPRKSGGGRASFSREITGPDSGGQSGDLQGLSDVENVDSESVDELIEEGNAFEAGVVSGVEDSGRRGVKEVRTRELPEDDVPEEYLDQD